MPAYEYVCKDCSHEFLVFLSIKEFESNPKIRCPHCQSDNVQKKKKMNMVIGAFFSEVGTTLQ
jgi:putative FmdB family regulatory protein